MEIIYITHTHTLLIAYGCVYICSHVFVSRVTAYNDESNISILIDYRAELILRPLSLLDYSLASDLRTSVNFLSFDV